MELVAGRVSQQNCEFYNKHKKQEQKKQCSNCQIRHVLTGSCVQMHSKTTYPFNITFKNKLGAQWLSGRVLDSRPRGRGFKPHRRHCVVVLEQDTFILA